MKKSILLVAGGAILGPALMGLLKIMIFAIGLAAIICGALYFMGGSDE